MSQLSDNRDLMMEVLYVLTKRSGGYIKIDASEAPKGPFNLLSRFSEEGGLELMVDSTLPDADEAKVQ